MLSRFTTSSFRAARPQPPALLQNVNVNLLVKIPMSISSPKCQCSPPRQTANFNPFARMHYPRAPHSFSVLWSPCRPHLKLSNPWNFRPLYLPGFDSHSSLPISARKTSIELYLARSATHRTNLSRSHLSLTPRLEVL
jgi:hypothetical protein